MRFATASFIVAFVLFLGGATSLIGSWAVSAACLLFLTAAVAGAVAMEERDLAAAEEEPLPQPSTTAGDGPTSETRPVLLDVA